MVEWKKLGDIADISNGERPISEILDSGTYPYINAGRTNSGYLNECNSKSGAVTTPSHGEGGIGSVLFQYQDFWCGALCYKMYTSEEVLDRYLFHYLSNNSEKIINCKNVGGQPYINRKQLENIIIAVPTFSEQTRIVGILDTFTASIDNLKEQIAERRKQYEHYRDQLLDLEGKEGVEMKIEDFCQLKAGKSIKAEEISVENNGADYPCYGGNGIRGYVSFYSHDGEFPIIGRQGALCGCVNWATGKFYATEHAVVAKGNDKVNQRFLLHLFQHADLNQYKTQGAQPGLSVANLNQISFAIPSISEQSRIVSILDTFEASIQNLEAQLKEREKQYEYYRNKLLTFE